MSEPKIEFVVIAGMAKTGTTLPLTLLDGHPDLIVFPEELRFFHLGCNYKSADKAIDVFLNNGNIKNLGLKDEFFDSNDYLAHGGTGFGVKNYQKFDFKKFQKLIRKTFRENKDAYERFVGIAESFINSDKRSKKTSKRMIFVSKAPHNELFIDDWNKMLGGNVKYIICTRLPTEHYTSLKNVSELQGKNLSVFEYIYDVKERAKTWSHFPKDRTLILDYDRLTTKAQETMKDVADFLDIPFHKNLLKPTKFGKPWAGNSSRGIVKEKVYKNRHVAKDRLSEEEISTIEYLLRAFYESNGWKVGSKIDSKFDRFTVSAKYLLVKTRNSIKSFVGRAVFGAAKKIGY